MRRRWFGSHWGDSLLLMGNHVATPVGASCVKCATPIGIADQGWFVGGESVEDVDVEAHLMWGPIHLHCGRALADTQQMRNGVHKLPASGATEETSGR